MCLFHVKTAVKEYKLLISSLMSDASVVISNEFVSRENIKQQKLWIANLHQTFVQIVLCAYRSATSC